MNWSSSKSFITRALPFAATFMVAVFITSLFVDLNGPRMRGFHGKRHQEMMRLRVENQELRNENRWLKNELESYSSGKGHEREIDHEVLVIPNGGQNHYETRKDSVPVVPHAKR